MPASNASQLRIGHAAIKISLVRVVPGKETIVANSLRAAIRKRTRKEPIRLLKTFGNYDIAAIYESDEFMPAVGQSGTIPGILASNQILAFGWEQTSQPQAGSEISRVREGAWGLLFFKMHQRYCEEYGGRIEEAASDYWTNSIPKSVPGARLWVLGSFGWGEMVVVVRGKSFLTVAAAINKVSQQAVNGGDIPQKLFSIKTFSILGLDFDLVHLRSRKRLVSKFSEPIADGADTFPVLSVTCSPGQMAKVVELTKSKYWQSYSTFGSVDLQFRLPKHSEQSQQRANKNTKPITWGEFIASVLDMRSQLNGQMYSTSIGILSLAGVENLSRDKLRSRDNRGVQVSASEVKQFGKWGESIQRHVLDAYFGISGLLQDPVIGDSFEDLRQSLNVLLRSKLQEEGAEQNEGLKNETGALLDAITFGAQERLQGTFLAMEQVQGPLSPTKGGAQRVILAIEAIPFALLSKLRIRWNGFAVIGFQGLGFSTVSEVVNVPFQNMFHPEEWWGLFHETGHVAFQHPKFVNLDSAKAEGMLNAIVGGERERDPGEYDYWKNNVFYEVGADLFSLYLCYGKDFEFFLKNLWDYLKPIGVRGKEEIYFARSFCLYESWKHLLSTGRRRFPDKNLHLDRDIAELTRILARLGFHIQAKSRAQDEARQMFVPIRSLLEWYVQEFRLRATVTDLEKGLSKAKNALAAVSRGRVFTGGIDEPHIFILGLKQKSRKKPLDISVRIAAILSLWDTALRKRKNTT